MVKKWIVMIVLFAFFGCSKEIKSINDFSRFSTMVQDKTDIIEVEFDNYSGTPFYFVIENRDDIDDIMKIIFSSSFKKMKMGLSAGDNTSIKIIQGEKKYNMHVSRNKEGGYYYSFKTTELQEKIYKIAQDLGAFELIE